MSNTSESPWVNWNGGGCPVNPDQLVQVRYVKGGPFRPPVSDVTQAQFLRWTRSTFDSDGDIVAYRLCGAPVAIQSIDEQTSDHGEVCTEGVV